ncbi:hypothetical protein EBR21_03675 [bacterium]|nr:hypothetical protein [bacterium]
MKNKKIAQYLKKLSIAIAITSLVSACGSSNMVSNAKAPEGNASKSGNTGTSAGGEGKTGSTARFNVMNNKLYTISGGGIAVFDITAPASPTRSGFTAVAGDIETLFNDEKNLFVGAQSAMYIYSVANPDRPSVLGIQSHARSCDPVVTSGNLAYVTLRSDNQRCRGNTNVLKVINIQNPNNPFEVASLRMFRPTGLGIADQRLFVCDGLLGMVEFDLGMSGNPRKMNSVRDEICSDIIPLEKTIITTGVSGISQYDIQQGRLVRLSRIDIEK